MEKKRDKEVLTMEEIAEQAKWLLLAIIIGVVLGWPVAILLRWLGV